MSNRQLPGESWAAYCERRGAAILSARGREMNQSTKAPLVDPSWDQGSRDQEIKGLVSSKPDQGVFDSTDEDSVKGQLGSEQVVKCPVTATMLERYGDIIGFVNGHPLCLKATNPDKAAGGWGIFPQALTNGCKEHGIAKVLDALRYTANYRAAKDRAKFFWHQLKKEA